MKNWDSDDWILALYVGGSMIAMIILAIGAALGNIK